MKFRIKVVTRPMNTFYYPQVKKGFFWFPIEFSGLFGTITATLDQETALRAIRNYGKPTEIVSYIEVKQ